MLFVSLFLRLCLYIIESDTVKSDCPMQENCEIFKDLIQTVSFTVCSGYIKKSSENDQLTCQL